MCHYGCAQSDLRAKLDTRMLFPKFGANVLSSVFWISPRDKKIFLHIFLNIDIETENLLIFQYQVLSISRLLTESKSDTSPQMKISELKEEIRNKIRPPNLFPLSMINQLKILLWREKIIWNIICNNQAHPNSETPGNLLNLEEYVNALVMD